MNPPTIPDLVTHLDPRNCGLTVQLSEQAAVEINARYRERMVEREAQLAQALNRAAELQDMLLKEKQWHAKLVRAVADEREEQLAKAVTECEEARAELAAMREAVAVTTALAEWSARYPRGVIYSASNRQMDAELIELEERAKAATTKLQPFIK